MTVLDAPEATAGARDSRRGRARRWNPWAIGSAAGVVVVWQLLSVLLGEASGGFKVVPGIQDVLGAYPSFAGYWPGGLGADSVLEGGEATTWAATLGLVYNSAISILRVGAGYLVGAVVGIGLALLVSWSRTARESISFLAHFARMMPLLAMLPLFALWFGASELGTILFVAFAVGVLLFAIAANAIGNVPLYYSQYSVSLGAGRLRTYLIVVLPAILPQIRGGMLLAVAFSWSAVLAGELLGKQYGLGRILNFALYYAATDLIALTGLVVIIISALTYGAVNKLMTWATRWAE